MAKSLKDYLMEKGLRKGLAIELDEMALALKTRMVRLKVQGAQAAHILIELGRYRRLEQKTPTNLMQMLRICLDMAQVSVNFGDRLRILERYGIMKLNYLTAEYELTEFARQFYPDVATPA